MRRLVLVSALAACASCAGPYVSVSPRPPDVYSEIGLTSGSACGMLLFDAIPVAFTERTQRAYDRAVARIGASSLVDTSITTRWYFAGVGTVHCVDVDGTGVR
jgi:hypothetical protein